MSYRPIYLNEVDTLNSSTALLSAGATFTGSSRDVLYFNSLSITISTDQNSDINEGLVVYFSQDGATWDYSRSYRVFGNIPEVINVKILGRYYYIKYKNGDTPLTKFNLQSILKIEKDTTEHKHFMRGFGERLSVGETTTGEDIYVGTATTIPEPSSSGIQMQLVSSSVDDISPNSGVHSVLIHYLDANGLEQYEEVALNGTTPVATLATNIRWVQYIHSNTVGTTGAAIGDISIQSVGGATTYNVISAGGNMSLSSARMVPANKYLMLTGWHYAVATRDSKVNLISIRLRSTDIDGELKPNIFIFKDIGQASTGQSHERQFSVPLRIPPLSIVKISAWSVGSSGLPNVSAGFEGYLINNFDYIAG